MAEEEVPSPKLQAYEVAPELVLVVVKALPRRHWVLLLRVKAAVG